MLTSTELKNLEEIIVLIKPLEYVTKVISGEQYVTISQVIPLINCLVSEIESLEINSDIGSSIKLSLREQIARRFGMVEKVQPLAISTILDPRFKNIHFKKPEACSTAMQHIRRTITEQSTISNSSSESDADTMNDEYNFWKKHRELAHEGRKKRVDDELAVYLKSPVTPLKSNLLETWEDLKEVFPGLYRQFRQHAMIVAPQCQPRGYFQRLVQQSLKKEIDLNPKGLTSYSFWLVARKKSGFDFFY